MKHRILFFILSAAALCSCNKQALDLSRTDAFSDLAVWSTADNADLYLTGAYCTFRDISNVGNFETCFYDGMSDLFKDTGWYAHNNSMNIALLMETGFTSNSAGIFECWASVYNRIRVLNQMLREIDLYGGKFGSEFQTIRKAEIRFCRAYNYYRLARVYGGVPLRTENSGSHGGMSDGVFPEDVPMARASEYDTYKFILEDLKYAAENLPESWPSKWYGRANKKSAYAFISRIALYLGDNTGWDMAIDAASQCAKLGAGLVSDYAALFDKTKGQSNMSEVLFELGYLKGSLTHHYDIRMRPCGDQGKYGVECYAYFCPTEELVSMYEFKDGTPFDWKTYRTLGHSDPYTDREPRFHATVLYHGAPWDGRTIDVSEGGADSFSKFELQTGNVQGHTCTGYYTRKYIQESNGKFSTDYSDQTDNVIRYAEVLLNKAEALCNKGEIQEALKPINEVRSRVGLPARTASNRDELMEILRHEKCVELAGEGLRYWDIRRWKIARSIIDGQTVHAVTVSGAKGDESYTVVDADGGAKRIFPEKYYYYAIPSDEISNNKLCEQNPNW